MLTAPVVLSTLVHVQARNAVVSEHKALLAVTVERTLCVLTQLVTASVFCGTLVHICKENGPAENP